MRHWLIRWIVIEFGESFLAGFLKGFEDGYFPSRSLQKAYLSDKQGRYAIDGVSYDGKDIHVAGTRH